MSKFEIIYKRACRSAKGGKVSPELKPLLERFYQECLRKPSNLSALKSSMSDLFEFLCSPAGRTRSNCWVVDLFVCIDDDWETDFSHLPSSYSEIIEEMGGSLHDAVDAPEYGITLEKLWAKCRQIKTE